MKRTSNMEHPSSLRSYAGHSRTLNIERRKTGARHLLSCSLFLILFSLSGLAIAADSAPAVVWALEQDGNPKIGPQSPPPYLDELAKLGVNVVYPDKKAIVPLDWEQLKKCNMVILTGFPNKLGLNNIEAETLGNLLDRYMNEGGGVLYIGQASMDTTKQHDAFNKWLAQYGAECEWATVEDETHSFTKAPKVPWQLPGYLWTENIEASTITKDVKRLYFPNNVFYSPYLRPLKVNADWNVLFRAEKAATVFPLTRPLGGGVGKKIAGQERSGDAAVLMAVRQVGKGRLAVLGANPGALYFDLGKPVGAQTASVRGDGENLSDWLKLLRNVCFWLSEPARSAGFPGGAKERVTCYVNPEFGNRVPIDWERPGISWPDCELTRLYAMHSSMWKEADWRALAAGQYKPFKFLVGAHTAKTGGKGSVADWKAAAQKAGFDGVVFREKILEMSEAQWKEFETECAVASDDKFLAFPGQEFEDWEGNRFMRFNQSMSYPNKERLTEDGKKVKQQLPFFFDAGWPANFPISVKSNSAPFSDYRVYSAFPVAVYQGGKQIEDNRTEWAELMRRIEYVTPLGLHLLEDPSEVAASASDTNLVFLAPSLADIRSSPRWGRTSMGTGVHNSMAAFASDGPVIEAFLPMNMYRTTLGDRGVPGSYRYRLIIRARSDVPVERVEVWAGDRQLRVFRPGTKEVMLTVDDEHSQESGLWIKMVDAKKREALATSVMIHDKMLCYVWCGDHCNVLPFGQGVDKQGNAYGIGIGTHVKDQFSSAGGPGVSSSDACSYIPWGTDTSSPGLGIKGTLELTTTAGRIPAQNQVLFPDLYFQYATRDVIQTRLATSRFADLKKYGPDKYGMGYISGWGPYLKSEPLEEIEVVSDDIDFHRNADEPALQLCRGVIRFKKDVTMAGGQAINLLLGRMSGGGKGELLVSTGATPKPGKVEGKLGKGGYLTWGYDFGNGTLISFDDNFDVSTAADAAGKMTGNLTFGYALGDRTFKKGDTLSYQFIIMLWPMGKPVSDRLDTKLLSTLNIASPKSGFTLSADCGKVIEPGFVTTLEAEGGVFMGTLKNISADIRIPVRIKGLNPNWTAGVWTGKPCVFGPIGNDRDGYAWTSLDPVADAGKLFIGNIVSCGENTVILRAFQLLDGGWRITAHNPGEKAIKTQVKGTDGGPLTGHTRQASLAPGEEQSWLVTK
jgi:hypothetical protein